MNTGILTHNSKPEYLGRQIVDKPRDLKSSSYSLLKILCTKKKQKQNNNKYGRRGDWVLVHGLPST